MRLLIEPRLLLSFLAIAAFARCSLAPNSSDSVELRVGVPHPEPGMSLADSLHLPQTESLNLPSSVDGFDCYGVNVFGGGIGSGNGPNGGFIAGCPYMGITSSLVTSNQGVVTLQVPSGPQRTIQMVGVATGSGCDTSKTLAQFFQQQLQPTPNATPSVQLAELGRTRADLSRDTQITIQNTFPTAGPGGGNTFPFFCNYNDVINGPTLALTAGYSGSLSVANFTEAVGASLPPVTGIASTISAPQLSAIGDPTNLTTQYFTGTATSQYEGVDLLFSVNAVDIVKFPNFHVDASFAGGGSTYSGGCNTPATITSGFSATPAGVNIAVYKGTGTVFSSGRISDNNVTSFLTSGYDFKPEASITQAAVSLGGTFYLMVSLRSQSQGGGGTYCSEIGINYVRVTLEP